MVGKFLASGAPQVLHNVPGEEGFHGDKLLDEDSPASLAWIPLKKDGEIQGFLLFSCQQRHYFTADDIDFLSILAEHVTAAITNQQLQQTEKALVELATLRSKASSVPEFLEGVIGQFLPKNFSCCATSVLFVNEAKDKLALWKSTGIIGQPSDEDVWYREGEGMTGWVWEQGQSLRVPDDVMLTQNAMEKFSPPPKPARKHCEMVPPGVRPQVLAVPIKRGDEITGVLRMCGRADDRRFAELDERLATRIGEQLGHDIHNLQALDSRQRRLDTLGQVVEVIQFEAEERNILYLALSGITCGRGLGFNRAGAWLLDESGEWLEPRVAIGATSQEEARRIWEETGILTFRDIVERFKARGIKIDQSLQDRFKKLRRPFRKGSECVLNKCCDLRETQQYREKDLASLCRNSENAALSNELGDHHFVLVPLEVGNECVGVIYADNAFDRKPIHDEDVSLLKTFARQAGMAIWRVRANRQRERRAELDEKVTHEIVQEPASDNVLDRILAHMEEAFGFKKYLVYFHDAERDVVSVLGSHGFERELARQISFRVTATEKAIATRVIQSRRPYFTADAESDTAINKDWQRLLELRGPVLGLPLRVGDTVCGALIINHGDIAAEDEKRLKPCVNDLAVAVTLADQTRKRRAANETIELMSNVQSSFPQALDNEPGFLSHVAEQVARILNAKLCAIYRPVKGVDGEESADNRFERLGAYGYPESARQNARVARTGKRAGLTNHVLAGEILNVPDVKKDPRWRGEQRHELEKRIGARVRAFLGVPMFDPSTGKVIGGITLTRSRRSVEYDGLDFHERDVALVQAIATAVASLLRTLDGHRKLKETFERLEDAHSQLKRRNVELDALFNAVADKLPEEVSVVDRNFTITYANPAKEKKFSEECSQNGGTLKGRKCYEVYEKRKDVCPSCPIQTAMERARSGDRSPVEDKTHFGWPTGKPPYQALVIASAIVDPDADEVVGGVEVVTDLSETESRIDTAVQHGAHVVRQNLEAARTRLDGVDADITEGQIQIEPAVHQELRRLRELIEDAHDSAVKLFVPTTKVEMDSEPCRLAEQIKLLLAESQPSVHFRLESSPPQKEWKIRGDNSLLKQVFRELLANAVKATSATGKPVRIGVQLAPWLRDGEEDGLRILFADNGPGIPREARERVFERFFSLQDGRGLGLDLVRRIISGHGGLIRVCDEPEDLGVQFPDGVGAVFEICLQKGYLE
jgi:GAF domain-containing protein